MQYHLNGELVPREKATVSVDDRGFRYGDAVFETCRAYGGEVYAWDRHVDRLREGCETLGMAEAAPDDLAVRVAETLDAMLDSADRREELGAAGREHVVDHYSRATIADELDELLAQLVSADTSDGTPQRSVVRS